MIKLIASDLDGSLLDTDRKLPPGFFELLRELRERDITFVAASGRSYVTLKQTFAEAGNDISFIADNGSCVVEHGEITRKDVLANRYLAEIIEVCEPIPDVKMLFCGVNGTYHLPYSKEYSEDIGAYYINQVVVDDLRDIKDDIYKIAFYDPHNPVNNAFPVINKHFGERFEVIISGQYWMDITNQGVNKGVALNAIQEHLGVTRAETMAFGDFYNDIELLAQAEYSFVMENANPDMRQYGKYLAKSNAEYGVIQAIREYVF